MTDITIPDEAVKAVHDLFEPGYLESIGLYPEAIIRAAINAWPGMWHINAIDFEGKIILPLYKESTNAEG